MSTPIKPKRSYTATSVPSGLSAGEIAVNAADGKVWIGSSDGKSNVLISSLSLSDMAGTTSNVTEGSNLYYTDSRARLSLSAGTGISYDNKTGSITNSSPDQTVVLTAGTGISTSGTYPNFTITNSSPDQTVKLTSGTGISVTGTYPDFTITNSSPSSGGTVTSVAMSVPTGLSISGTPITSSGTLAVTLTAGYSIPTTSSQTNWDTAYTNRITSLTTTGSSGAATLVSNTLNVPTYTLAGLGGQASSTNLTSLSGLNYVSASFVKMTSSGTFSLDTATYLTANQSITLSGDVTGTGTTAITTTLATVSIAKGGTGQTTQQAAINALTGTQSNGKYLRSDGTNATLSSIQAADVPTLNQNTSGSSASCTGNSATATSLAGGGAGQIPYNTGSGATSFLAAGTSGQLLQSNGTSAPSWVASPGVPTGSLFPYAGSSAPTGYLLCDGSAVSRTTYATLFGVLSTTYGAGNGSTTFNLPDLRGRMPLGAGTGVGLNASGTGTPSGTAQTARTAGQWGGEETHLLTSSEMPQHNHTGVTGYMSANASHAHTLQNLASSTGSTTYNIQDRLGASNTTLYTNYTNTDHYHTIPYDGSSTRHATMPPFIVANYIIKT
jgi:microcystin-dependent protein